MSSPASLDSLRARLCQRLRWEALDPVYLKQLVAMARMEDLEGAGLKETPLYTGDLTTRAVAEPLDASKAGAGRPSARAALVARGEMTLAGLPLLPLIVEDYASSLGLGRAPWRLHFETGDGARLQRGAVLAILEGPPEWILTVERVLLNFLQRLSGIATTTAVLVEALGETPTRLLDTRKTTPGFRMLEKYAVGQGGGWNHRLGLFDRVMLKDNHLALLESGQRLTLAQAVERARRQFPEAAVEIEVDRPDQIPLALATGCEIILLDNFDDASLAQAVEQTEGRALTEASGSIDGERLKRLGALGLDFVSTGAVVHRSAWCDIGLDWQPAGHS
ncbi:MAG: carboxylating nicotinate-nucleotide diphosphorylase [Opitutales bacterium]